MPTITEYLQITRPVPFVNVELSCDNGLYLDPHALRLSTMPEPFRRQAVTAIDTFLNEVVSCLLSASRNDHARGLALLQQFVEPWETRLGMAAAGFRGHGGASDVGRWIWGAFQSDLRPLVRVGMMRQLEGLPLFIEGIDRDRTSDITTRLAFDALIQFTADVVANFDEFTTGAGQIGKFRRQIWDIDQLEWSIREVELPLANGEPVVLVPKGWARPTLLMSADRFYGTSVLSFAQLERATIRGGKLVTTPKRVLRTDSTLARGRATNLAVTQRALRADEDLVATFKSLVDSRWTESVISKAA
ncbi:hypothetical protein [Rathayibacter tritici]|uniref:Uncharacterized protein n=1 Tax=Rathayibacter tritici TaxID=33888 RepID=A0A160KPY2_9MICO|nr:hypothetical protein [Rathayibacter tritici]AND15363.1 hypothetical protein A6122_0199 [Rathayibacter tritici]PPF23506.1 hypothetical protein C5C06_14050 [Rathayibacter tritici]PPI19042.1 hypothetical protein C5D07_02535 [Rathayibacter tritici]PPI47955.1 hypothetical protein C5D18_02520 [Rathayibacter tritici]